MTEPITIPVCPVCGLEMLDVRAEKTKATQPDFKCQDSNCKYQWDKDSKEYVPSKFITSAWLPKTNGVKPAIQKPVAKTAPQVQKQIEKAIADKNHRIDKAIEHKDESINWANAKNNATQLICNVNIWRIMATDGEIKAKLIELAEWFYQLEPPIVDKFNQEAEEEEISVEEIPF